MKCEQHSPLCLMRGASMLMPVALSVIGCAAAPHSSESASTSQSRATIDSVSAADRSRRLLLGSELGLEVREWIIEADIATIGRVMSAYSTAPSDEPHGAIIGHALADRLRLNGLRLVPVRVADLPAIEAELGYATLNRRGWYGQVVEWMHLHGQRAGGPEQALFIDGRARRFERGEYRLMCRAWILPMEDGPRLNLQLVPEYQPPQRESIRHLLAEPTHDGTRRGEPIPSIALDLLIRPGYALILTGEEPGVDWTAETAEAEGRPDGEIDRQRAPEESAEPNEGGVDGDGDTDAGRAEASRRSRNAENPPFGPHAALPPTLGEMLFTFGGLRAGRGMLIFVPRVPDELDEPVSAREGDSQ